jgi:hypothetical protein
MDDQKKWCQKIVTSQNGMNEAEKQELSGRFIYSFVELGLRNRNTLVSGL